MQRSWAVSSVDIVHIGTIVPLMVWLCECLVARACMRCVSPLGGMGGARKSTGQRGDAVQGCFDRCYPLHSTWFHALG